MCKKCLLFLCGLYTALFFVGCKPEKGRARILVFAKTNGFYHESIPAGIAAIKKLGEQKHFLVDTTTDPSFLKEVNLKKYRAVVFLSTTGNVLNADQQLAFQRYIQAGGGFAGIHAAADAEYNWAWYNKLVGAYFMSHPNDPNVRKATVVITDTTGHAAMAGLPQRWERTDEWYNYKNISPSIKVLARLDEESYEGGENGDNHPIAWYHEYDGGRAFYTGGGHTTESFSEPLFLQHLAGGLQYAMGDTLALDYAKSYAVKSPEENRFTKVILSNDLNEPMELAVAPDGRAFFVERLGKFYMYDPITNATKLVYTMPVLPDMKDTAFGNGLLGITLDPHFSTNNYIYFFYTPNKLPSRQNVSRFIMRGRDSLDLSSEKVIIEIPIDLEVSAHTGGSMAWDKNNNLFISTGDNTVPFASEGYAPIDEIHGRMIYDAQRSSGNTNDLRGKILRIHPEADGSYTVPEGNLFPKGAAGTRPEIYTMGCRNPYRISVDPVTSILYWGEVGPDAGQDAAQGPRGYDEFNQAKKPGNYGWPYFVGNNKPYHDYDFANKTVQTLFDTAAPVNSSPNNTGLKTLPPATPAMIWYPYNSFDVFPELGQGGRSAIGGPVYHFNSKGYGEKGLPEYYDKALFVTDWMRNWVFAVRLDDNQVYKRTEEFMPLTGDFRRPIDMEITPGGILYILEYGTVYGIDNTDARLVRLEYNGGNRAPVAAIHASDSLGTAPLKVRFSSSKSYDFDEDDILKYEWQFSGTGPGSTEADPEYTFTKNGVYKVVFKATDPSGMSDTDTMDIIVGNTMPDIAINTSGNSTFYFDGGPLNYSVTVNDKEDKNIERRNIAVSLNYIPKEVGSGNSQNTATALGSGKALMDGSDCKACHQMNAVSAGPSFMQVARRYNGKPGEIPRLANKIITGGAGVWGDHYMNGHPQLSIENTTTIVKYILSLANQRAYDSLPENGTMKLDAHRSGGSGGNYVLRATYKDQGNGVIPLTGLRELVLRPSRVEAEDADIIRNTERSDGALRGSRNNSYFVLKDIDLKSVGHIHFRYSSREAGATIEVHANSAKGPLVATATYAPTGDRESFREVSAPVNDPGGKRDLYFVFRKEAAPDERLGALDWVEFKR